MNDDLEKMVQSVKMQQNILSSRTSLFLLTADLIQEQRNLLTQAVGTIDALKAELKKHEPNPQQDGGAVRTQAQQTAGKDHHRPPSPDCPDESQVGGTHMAGNSRDLPRSSKS